MSTPPDAQTSALPPTLRWEGGELYLLDQTRLPLEAVEEKQETVAQVWESIKVLKVRGAPAIGVAGAYGLVVAMRDQLELAPQAFLEELARQAAYLDGSRPTAVNLGWGLRRMVARAASHSDASTAELFAALVNEAETIHAEDQALCRGIGESGAPLIRNGMGILTHCNAGALATAGIGTALAPMYVAHAQGTNFRVYADETRPLLQGARLTTWELQQAGIDVTLITDNMAAHIMSQGLIDLVIVGADRVAANGDAANKIGTLGVAILAAHFEIPMYVAIPYSTIDFDLASGAEIPIEERGAEEITHFGARRTAPEDVQTRSPAFDVTPHHLLAGIITNGGIISPPYTQNLRDAFRSEPS